jgi:hypothetical protein
MSRFYNLIKELGIPYIDSHWKNKAGFDIVIYIPENAETLNETYTYDELYEMCREWSLDNKNYCNKEKLTAKDLMTNMMDTIDWQFPNTWLEELLNFN